MSDRYKHVIMHGLNVTDHAIQRFLQRKDPLNYYTFMNMYASIVSALSNYGQPMYTLRGENKLKSHCGVTFIVIDRTVVTCW